MGQARFSQQEIAAGKVKLLVINPKLILMLKGTSNADVSFSLGNDMTEITEAERAIRRRIREQGRITFAEFMETALYHPVDGYYSSDKPFGASGDYFTSPAVHPAFGALLAVQLYGMWRRLGKPPDFTAVEMGAGNGMLAHDITTAARQLSGRFAESLNYICVDRYAPQDAIEAHGEGRLPVEWVRADRLPLHGVVGCFISNELVDAFPIHRFEVVDGEALEVYVSLDDKDEFVEVLDEPSTPLLRERLNSLNHTLEDGHRGEVSLRVRAWLNSVAQAVARGFIITIDYGYSASELYSPKRRFGTLQTYYRHTEGGSPYRRIGRQDISAHVDFTLLKEEGRAAGLNVMAYRTQADWLRLTGMEYLMQKLRRVSISRHERSANVMALHELMKSDGLGGFKALIQEKGTGVKAYGDIVPNEATLQGLTPPLLSDRHMPLMEGRYPHTVWEATSLWGEWRPTT